MHSLKGLFVHEIVYLTVFLTPHRVSVLIAGDAGVSLLESVCFFIEGKGVVRISGIHVLGICVEQGEHLIISVNSLGIRTLVVAGNIETGKTLIHCRRNLGGTLEHLCQILDTAVGKFFGLNGVLRVCGSIKITSRHTEEIVERRFFLKGEICTVGIGTLCILFGLRICTTQSFKKIVVFGKALNGSLVLNNSERILTETGKSFGVCNIVVRGKVAIGI